MTELDEYWQKFLKDTNRDENEKCAGDLFFEAKGFINDQLILLILNRKKTAFFTSWATYSVDKEPLPVSGELYIVLHKNETPACVIEIQRVCVVPFNEVTWEMAKLEGEDNNLEQWRERKQEYLEEEGEILGFEFSPDIKLVFQTFQVIYRYF